MMQLLPVWGKLSKRSTNDCKRYGEVSDLIGSAEYNFPISKKQVSVKIYKVLLSAFCYSYSA